MELPIPPTGGQGGRYGSAAGLRTRKHGRKTKASATERARVPRRWRNLRLKRRRRARMERESNLGVVIVFATIVGTLALLAFGFHHFVRLGALGRVSGL